MKNSGVNMVMIKQNNRSTILKVLKSYGALSRKDIADIVNLTPAAVTILISEMIAEGIVKEMGQLEEEDKRAGRKKILVDINYNHKYVMGINIESEKVCIGIANLKGEIVNQVDIQADPAIPPEDLLCQVVDEYIQILWKENILKQDILGVGVGIVGKLDITKGESIHAYGLWKEKVAVRDILQNKLDLPVTVDNNVRALALTEMDYGRNGDYTSLLFVKYGPGLGSTMIINREVYYGSHYTAGEIGHMIIDKDGLECKCGNKGCLEAVASYKAIMKEIKALFSKQNSPHLYELCKGDEKNIHIQAILSASERGDEKVRKILMKTAEYIARGIYNAVKLYDPEKVVLFGEIFKNAMFKQFVLEAFENLIAEKDSKDILEVSALNSQSVCLGGVTLAIRKFFYQTGGKNTNN